MQPGELSSSERGNWTVWIGRLALLVILAALIQAPGVGAARAQTREAPPVASEARTIYLVQDAFHTDLVIPRSAFYRAPMPIRRAVARTLAGSWIIVGWGPGWFGRQASGVYHPAPMRVLSGMWTTFIPQTHSQLRMAALFTPSAAPGENPETPKPVVISAAGLDNMIRRINASLKIGPDGGPIVDNEDGAAPGVRLYRSRELYHLAHECNQWAGEVLHAGGLETSYILDLLPGSLEFDLRRHEKEAAPSPDAASGAAGD